MSVYLNGFDGSGGLGTTVRTTDSQGQAIKTLPGYDALKGVGIPNGESFLDALD